jgi:ABC-type xylose transport system permease subunit
MFDEFLTSVGIHLQDLVAGFAGGVANAFIFKKSKPWAIIGSIVVGGFAANYLGALVAKILGTSPGTSAFIVGLAGMAICQGIVESAGSWSDIRKLKND